MERSALDSSTWITPGDRACSSESIGFFKMKSSALRALRMEKIEEAFVLTGAPQEFEPDSIGRHGSHHGGHFHRNLLIVQEHLEIEDIVDLHDRLAFDNTTTHGDIPDYPMSAYPASGKGQRQ